MTISEPARPNRAFLQLRPLRRRCIAAIVRRLKYLIQSQRDRLQLIHSYEWLIDDGIKSRSRLAQRSAEIESIEERWFASLIIQLAINGGQLQIVLDHPWCGRGIACWIYWERNLRFVG